MSESEQAVQVAKVKNQQFIGGLVDKTQDKAENYVKDTRHFRMKTMQTFWDGFLAGITCGIYTPSTTYYYEPVKKQNDKKGHDDGCHHGNGIEHKCAV